jgi:phasin family protein
MLQCSNSLIGVGIAGHFYIQEYCMNTLSVENLSSFHKNAFTLAQNMVTILFSGVEKYAELNMGAAKSAVLETGDDFLAALSATSATDALAAQASLVKPLIEKSISYSRSVYNIAAQTNAALVELAESQFSGLHDSMMVSMDEMAKNAPAGSESLVTIFKSSMAAGQNAIDTAKQSAKKAMQQAEQQAAAVTDTALQSVKTTSRKK